MNNLTIRSPTAINIDNEYPINRNITAGSMTSMSTVMNPQLFEQRGFTGIHRISSRFTNPTSLCQVTLQMCTNKKLNILNLSTTLI